VVHGGGGQKLKETIGHGQASAQDRNDGHAVIDLNTIEVTHGGLDGLVDDIQAAGGLETEVEGDLSKLSAELIRGSVDVPELSHLSSNQRVGRLNQRHLR